MHIEREREREHSDEIPRPTEVIVRVVEVVEFCESQKFHVSGVGDESPINHSHETNSQPRTLYLLPHKTRYSKAFPLVAALCAPFLLANHSALRHYHHFGRDYRFLPFIKAISKATLL